MPRWTEEDFKRLEAEGNVEILDDSIPPPAHQVSHQVSHQESHQHLLNHLASDPITHVATHGSHPEVSFAAGYLEDRVDNRESLGWAFEPFSIRMIGQTYTPDFVEWGADGVTRYYEVKGAK